MERIAPLAKILAEANGIDWRNLHGSGEGGLIVEGDILSYLSRIMSGEEEPPATPVDAPPPEWNGTELPPGGGLLAPGMPSMDMLSSAGVDSDLAALVGQPQAAAPAPVTLEEEALEFELEEDEQPLPAPQPERRPVEVAAFAAPAFKEVAPVPAPAPEFVPPAPVLGRERPSAPLDHTPGLAAVAQPEPVAARAEPTPPPAAPAGGLRGGLGGLLSRLYQQPAPTPAAPPAQPTPAPVVPEVPAAAAEPVPAPQLPVAAAPVVEAPVVEVPAPAPELQPEVRDVAEVEPEEVVALAPEMPAVPAVEEQPEVRVAEPEAALPEPAAMPVPEAARPRQAVSFGIYLRRDANLAPAAELRRQLSAALGQDVPLALLVARAAARHAESLGLNTVAVHDLDGGQARPVQPGSLRDALAALGTERGGTPDLLVIDAGALDLDDLHLGHTVTLSVGRLQDGRAALTLNGDVDAAKAARFLASVAATLEEPIILVI